MTTRISPERLDGLDSGSGSSPTRYEGRIMAEEIMQSRALVTELRALAERMRHYSANLPTTTFINDGKIEATDDWHSELDSLLSAHGGAESSQADAEGKAE